MERGIVRARVGLSYDPLRLSPCSAICDNRKPRGQIFDQKKILPRTPPQKQHNIPHITHKTKLAHTPNKQPPNYTLENIERARNYLNSFRHVSCRTISKLVQPGLGTIRTALKNSWKTGSELFYPLVH